ncbi:MAG: response regulator transcription factor [Phycisphaerae bacterium]|nr:response regulator transcription factor [Phycisphaerae bacterium]
MQAGTVMNKSAGLIRVLIVDDHQLCREGLHVQLESQVDFTVVGEAANADEGLSEALRHKPDLVLMDIEMPGVSCFDTIRRIHEQLPGTKVVILSGHTNDEQISQAVKAQAQGYAVKEEGFAQVCKAIRDVMCGKMHYAQEVLDRIKTSNGQLTFDSHPHTRLETLTPRERELLVLLAQGYSLKEAGKALHVSYKTVDKHKVNLMKKLDIHDRVELALFAVREGLVQPQSHRPSSGLR